MNGKADGKPLCALWNRLTKNLTNNFASIFVVSNTKKNYEKQKKSFLNTYIIVLIVNVIKCSNPNPNPDADPCINDTHTFIYNAYSQTTSLSTLCMSFKIAILRKKLL